MRERGESLAIVVDEYGSISGLISQEDLIEAMVGEISDRRDAKSRYTRSTDDVIIASGKLELSEFREIFGIPLKTHENILTLGGWLIEQLGDIPTPGTKYANDQFLFYILAADPNRIRRVYVRRLGGAK
jgi:CBS domain containing-hemolysin-like protein